MQNKLYHRIGRPNWIYLLRHFWEKKKRKKKLNKKTIVDKHVDHFRSFIKSSNQNIVFTTGYIIQYINIMSTNQIF